MASNRSSKKAKKTATKGAKKAPAARTAAPKRRPAAKGKPLRKPAPPARKPKATAKGRGPAKAKAKRGAGVARKVKPAAPKPRAKSRSPRSASPHIEAGPTELDTIKLAYLFRDTSPAAIYRALMDAAEHSAFTGDVAEIDARVGGEFRSYSGFIHGTTIELVPDARIVQSWRTKHFPRNNPSSTLELTITPVAEGTRLDMRHIDVPKPQVEYIVSGWVRFYLDPLAQHLGKRVSLRPPPL